MGSENGFCYRLVGRRRRLSLTSQVKSIWLTDTEAIRVISRFDDPVVGPQIPAVQPDRLFPGFLEAAPDAVVIIDGEGAIAQVNSQTEKMFGYRREELVGRPVEVLMPERFRGSHVGERREFSVNPYPRSMGRGLELFGLRKDGHEFPIDVSLSPPAARDGDPYGQHHPRHDRAATAGGRAAPADPRTGGSGPAKGPISGCGRARVALPLAVLTNVAQLLRSPQAGAVVHQQAVDALGRQTMHMARLVEDLLDVSRVRRGNVTLRREAVDLWTVISKAVEMGETRVDNRKHHLVVAQFPDPLWVSGDPTRLVQVVSNLLTNAAKYTPEGGDIWLSAGKEDSVATIRIRDNGVGIPVWASRRKCYPACSTCSRKFSPWAMAERKGWALGWPWCGGWSSCTAAPWKCAATAPAWGVSLWCVCPRCRTGPMPPLSLS